MSIVGGGTGVMASGRSKRLSLDKLPLLGEFFDKIATQSAETLRARASSPAQFRRRSMVSDSEEAVLGAAEGGVLVFLLRDAAWGCRIALVLDQNFVFTLIEAMLGGDGSDGPFNDARPFSTIKRGVAKGFADVVIDALNKGLTAMSPQLSSSRKSSSRSSSLFLGRLVKNAVGARLGIEALGSSGEMHMVLPQAVIERVGAHLEKSAAKEIKRADPQWSQQFERRVTGAEVLVGIRPCYGFCLGDIAGFSPGQVLPLALHMQKHAICE